MALLDAGVSLYEGYRNREFQREEAQHNRDFQLEMYERQFDDSVDWRTHNEMYNSPAAQMERYREAGINPMYYVTQNGGGSVIQTPMQANGSGYGSSVGTPSRGNYRLDILELARMRNENRLTSAQVRRADAETREINARAESEENRLPESRFYRDVWNQYAQGYHGTQDTWDSTVNHEAQYMMSAQQYKMDLQGLEFADAKAKFSHSAAVRKFEADLNEHKRRQFEYELSQAQDAASIFKVSAKWAQANQWINAGSQLLGAATGFVRAFKKPSSIMHERHYYGDTNNSIFNY